MQAAAGLTDDMIHSCRWAARWRSLTPCSAKSSSPELGGDVRDADLDRLGSVYRGLLVRCTPEYLPDSQQWFIAGSVCQPTLLLTHGRGGRA